jgi:T5SS/PEP-CTERM-associated repeat protein
VAATKFWKDSIPTGAWSTSTNWSAVSAAGTDNGGAPLAGEPALIAHTSGVAHTVTVFGSTPAMGQLAIDLTGAGATTNTLSLTTNNTLTAAGIFVGGHNGTGVTAGRGTLTQSAGTITTSAGSDLYLGLGAGSTGVYNLSGGSLNANLSTVVGSFGTATFNHSGGSHTLFAEAIGGALLVGYQSGSNGTYNLSGTGQLISNKSEYIGHEGVGLFNHTLGSNTINGAGSSLVLGNQATGNGTYTISGGLTVADNVIVGQAGTGTLNISGTGSVSVNDQLSIGAGDAVNLSGGFLRFNNYSRVATGQFNFTSGTLQLGGNRTVGSDATIADIFGALPTIGTGKTVAAEGAVTTLGNVNVNGGTLRSLSEIMTVGNAATSTLTITNGGAVTAQFAGIASGSQSSVSGAGSTWTVTNELDVDGNFAISNGGVVTSASGVINPGSGGGEVTTISGSGSKWTVSNNLQLSFSGKLDIQTGGLAHVGNLLEILGGANVILNGGTLRLNTLNNPSNLLIFNSGTLQLAGNRVLGTDPIVTQLFGANPTIVTGKSLTVEQTATLSTSLTVDGGTFSASQLVNAGLLDLRRGTLNLTNQEVAISSGGLFGDTLDVDEDVTINVTQGITNQGLVTGDGQIGGPFINGVSGELRASAGQSLKLTGSIYSYGQIKLLGGELESTDQISTAPGSLISGNGTIIARLGIFNQGVMNFAGTANIVGDVNNSAGGRIISGGGGATVFFDDVVNNAEIRTSANGFSVFFGSVSGSGTFTGTGTVNFEGDLKPGSSPATVNFGGDVSFGVDASLQIELGGTAPGTFDKISVAGDLALDGELEVSILPGFTPAAGQSFNILDWFGTRSGIFESLDLQPLAGLAWNTSLLYTEGIISLAAAGLSGDYNQDGTVDAADYTVWRNNLGSGTSLPNDDTAGVGSDDYDRWKTHFGESSGSGSGAISSTGNSVPEPEIITLLLVVGLCVLPNARRIVASKNSNA